MSLDDKTDAAESIDPERAGTPSTTHPAERDGTPSYHEVRNCTTDHVVVTGAEQRRFQISPLGTADVDADAIAAFAAERARRPPRSPIGVAVVFVPRALIGERFKDDHLRACGIRTASDHITVHDDGVLWNALLTSDPVAPSGRLDLVARAIGDDEWIADIVAWRCAAAPGRREFDVIEGRLCSL